MSERLPDEAAMLFREPPESFVAARDAMVARLRSEERRDEAVAVKALRRPTAAVWALDRLSEEDPSGVAELVASGTELRAAQQATLSSSGAHAERLRAATTARRAVVARLADVAGRLLREAGHATRPDQIASALEAASVDEATGRRLSEGTLERLPEPVSGFGDVFGLTAIPGGADRQEEDATPEPARARRAGPAAPTEIERDEAEAAVAARRRDRDAAARRAKTARSTADRLAVRAQGMRERLEAAEAEHAEAEARAGGAELEAARAERALAEATERLGSMAPS